MDPFLTSSSPVSPKTHPVVEGKPKVDGEAIKNIERWYRDGEKKLFNFRKEYSGTLGRSFS